MLEIEHLPLEFVCGHVHQGQFGANALREEGEGAGHAHLPHTHHGDLAPRGLQGGHDLLHQVSEHTVFRHRADQIWRMGKKVSVI